MSTAEAFVAGAKSRSDISDEEKALQARRHSQDTVDIVAGKNGVGSVGTFDEKPSNGEQKARARVHRKSSRPAQTGSRPTHGSSCRKRSNVHTSYEVQYLHGPSKPNGENDGLRILRIRVA